MDVRTAQAQAVIVVVVAMVIMVMVVIVMVVMGVVVRGALPVMIMMLAHRSPLLRPARRRPCVGGRVMVAGNTSKQGPILHERRNCDSHPRRSRHPRHISFEIEEGQRLRLTQPEGEQVADFISFNRADVRELLSMHSSRAVI
jgi:Domain of unknown function (DUF1989)